MEMKNANLIDYTHKMKNSKILVIGDIMMDRFVYGDTKRISPESPVPVLSTEKETLMLGGCGNVLANLADIGVTSYVLSVVGNDEPAQTIRTIAGQKGVDMTGLLTDPDRPTSTKIRFLAQSQHLLRVDSESTASLSPILEEAAIKVAKEQIPHVQAVILSDYGKGILTQNLIDTVMTETAKQGIPVLVDPKGVDYSRYKGATAITPNRKELSEATGGIPTTSDDEVIAACKKLLAESGVKNVVATRSEKGMSIVSNDGTITHLPTQAREVYDVSGAGDTVIALLAAGLAVGAPLPEAAQIANVAAGIVVSKVGTATVTHDELCAAMSGDEAPAGAKNWIKGPSDWKAARAQIKAWQDEGLRVGMTNGCFDIVHFGHVSYLQQARDRCDRLVMALNADASVKRLKGPTRPINDENSRAVVIGGLDSVDLVVLFAADPEEQDLPCMVMDTLRPDVIFKGGDYTVDQMPEAQVVLAYGGEVDIIPLYEGHSTTNIIAKSREE